MYTLENAVLETRPICENITSLAGPKKKNIKEILNH